jgi:hypothetical protein
MMVFVLVLDHFAVDRIFRAPLKACVAILAPVLPDRFFIDHLNVMDRAYFGTDTTAIAPVIQQKTYVRQHSEFIIGI